MLPDRKLFLFSLSRHQPQSAALYEPNCRTSAMCPTAAGKAGRSSRYLYYTASEWFPQAHHARPCGPARPRGQRQNPRLEATGKPGGKYTRFASVLQSRAQMTCSPASSQRRNHSLLRKEVQPLQHDPACMERRTLRLKCGETLGNDVGIHELRHSQRPLEKRRRCRRFPGSARSGYDNDMRILFRHQMVPLDNMIAIPFELASAKGKT